MADPGVHRRGLRSQISALLNPPALATAGGGRVAGAALPAALTARWFAPAWVAAVLAHGALATMLLLTPRTPPEPEPLVRLVFVEPPPPPPPPLGAPGGTGAASIAASPPPIEKPTESEKPKVPPTEPASSRLAHSPRASSAARQASAKPKAKPKPRPKREPAALHAPAAPAAGVAQGSAGGEALGVVGGVRGGTPGGVVGAAGDGPLPASQVARAPSLLHRIEPDYPSEARARGIEGLVLLETTLDRNGRVEPEVEVLRSIPALDDEAIEAVRRWRFRPARDSSGRAIRVILEIPIRFVLR